MNRGRRCVHENVSRSQALPREHTSVPCSPREVFANTPPSPVRAQQVREQYRNAAAKIFPDDSFLMRFYKNAIGEDGGEMNRADTICTRLFEDPTLLRNVDPKNALRKGKDGVPRFD